MKYNKTDRIIIVIQYLRKKRVISRKHLTKILDVTRANIYKIINELTVDKGIRKATLIEVNDGKTTYYILSKDLNGGQYGQNTKNIFVNKD